MIRRKAILHEPEHEPIEVGQPDPVSSHLWNAHFEAYSPLREAFANHLRKVACAMYDIEQVDSGRHAQGSENSAIIDCLRSAGGPS